MNPYRKWLITTLLFIAVPLLFIAGFNYCIDPLWLFPHANKYNQIQMPFNERQQKTNYLTFTQEHYDALLLGSSRITYIDQADFKNERVYNYAVNNMLPREYTAYIDYASKCNGRDFDTIYIGLDFFATNHNLKLPNRFEAPSYYIHTANQFAYRYTSLLSTDTLDYAWQNYKASRRGEAINFAYNRSNRKTLLPTSEAEKQQRIKHNCEWYGKESYGENYQYENASKILPALQKRYPNTRFVLFITPESQPLFDIIAKQNRLPDYERWIRDWVMAGGELYDFMTPNSITTSLENYYDASHVYPAVGKLIAARLSGHDDPAIPKDFGVLVNINNLDEHLQQIRQLEPKH